MAQVWLSPALIADAWNGPETCVGFVTMPLMTPLPTWPQLLSPQQIALPLATPQV
jgi:hypothetical protein